MSYQNIKFVDSDKDKAMEKAFKEFRDFKVAAFDLEEFWGKELCLIQISTPMNIYLFDALTLDKSKKFKDRLKQLFDDPHIRKLGFSCNGDLKELSRFTNCFGRSFQNIIDIQQIFKEDYKLRNQISLSKMAKIYFGKLLDKTLTCSDWR
jgi:ribonuclease D